MVALNIMFPAAPGFGCLVPLMAFGLVASGLLDEVKDRLHEPASRLSIRQQQRLAYYVLFIYPGEMSEHGPA